ncbi:MAG: hypothetical protein ACK5XN_21370 [Bacteroidota bacterium]|jgi:hypothetical protein
MKGTTMQTIRVEYLPNQEMIVVIEKNESPFKNEMIIQLSKLLGVLYVVQPSMQRAWVTSNGEFGGELLHYNLHLNETEKLIAEMFKSEAQ